MNKVYMLLGCVIAAIGFASCGSQSGAELDGPPPSLDTPVKQAWK